MSEVNELICDECGKRLEPFKRAHDCDKGEALRKAAHELFAPAMPLLEAVLAKAGTGILRGVFEVVADRDQLRAQLDEALAWIKTAHCGYSHPDAYRRWHEERGALLSRLEPKREGGK